MDTSGLLKHIERSNKFLISGQPPKFVGECQWVDVSTMNKLKGHPVLDDSQKKSLSLLPPLELPVTTHRFNCPIQNKQVSIGLYYYDIDGWIVNSAAIYYIVNYDIEMPDDLTDKIKALSLNAQLQRTIKQGNDN
jgi:hypothetical protein